MLDLESWASGSIIFCHWIFLFSVVKRLMPILALLPMLSICENLDLAHYRSVLQKSSGKNSTVFIALLELDLHFF